MNAGLDMTAMVAAGRPKEFAFSDKEFEYLSSLIRERAGIVFTPSKRDLVYARLARRLRALKLTTFAQYCDILQDTGPAGEAEIAMAINALTTNFTKFFREPHHFDFLRDQMVPLLFDRARNPSKRVRIWSAGCSTGQEPYTIAVSLRQAVPDIDSWDCRILATDIDDNALARAEAGTYPEDHLSGLSQEQRRTWMQTDSGRPGNMVFRPEVRRMISFRKLNLMGNWPMKGPFQVIFCRNVVIYFDRTTQARLFGQMERLLSPEGVLIIGHSESMRGGETSLKLRGQTIYGRTGTGGA